MIIRLFKFVEKWSPRMILALLKRLDVSGMFPPEKGKLYYLSLQGYFREKAKISINLLLEKLNIKIVSRINRKFPFFS